MGIWASTGHLTWEWTRGVRSFLHPFIYGLLYCFMSLNGLDTASSFIIGIKIFQAVQCTIGDVALFVFVRRVSQDKSLAVAAIFAHLTNWFSLYTYPRTYSNSLEAILFQVFLCYWPLPNLGPNSASRWSRFIALVVAAVCTIIRPSSAIIWFIFGVLYIWRCSWSQLFSLIFDATFAGFALLLAYVRIFGFLLDSLYYGKHVFTAWEFIQFNILERGASHYGTHSFHWYFTQAIPVILATYLPLCIYGFVRSDTKIYGYIAIAYTAVLSISGHKEFRFLLPVLPLLSFYVGQAIIIMKRGWIRQKFTAAMFSCLALMFFLVVFFLFVHQRAPIAAMYDLQKDDGARNIFFAMPCHSTPYTAYLHRHDVEMSFLDCSPPDPRYKPIETPRSEAERFFDAPAESLSRVLARNPTINRVLLFDNILRELEPVLTTQDVPFKQCNSFYNTPFPSGSQGRQIFKFCRTL